jgi:hypothetical protein
MYGREQRALLRALGNRLLLQRVHARPKAAMRPPHCKRRAPPVGLSADTQLDCATQEAAPYRRGREHGLPMVKVGGQRRRNRAIDTEFRVSSRQSGRQSGGPLTANDR